jgi:glycerophosphoryl diester phosphodiesterase
MKIATLTLLLACLAQSQPRPVAVIAHRGEHLHHVENTLPAFQAAYDAGADFFELDVRTTADHQLVLMHDSTVDRTTKGKGEVAKMTFDDLRALGLPTFDEALEFARGKIGVYIDSKRISPADAVAAVRRHQMEDHVVVYGGPAYLKEVGALEPKMRLMPEAENPPRLGALIEALHLKIAAFDASDFNDATIAVARAAHVDIFVDRLGKADNPQDWQDAIDRGAAGIQTDHPAELVAYLRSKGLHR